jgi:hypothetical protein
LLLLPLLVLLPLMSPDLYYTLMQDVKVATALNWQMFCGCIAATNPEPGSFDPLLYNASFAKEFAQVKQYAMPYVKEFKVRLKSVHIFFIFCHVLRL